MTLFIHNFKLLKIVRVSLIIKQLTLKKILDQYRIDDN